MAFPLPAQAHRQVLEQICRARLLIDEEGVLSDLHVNPINGNIEPGGQLYRTEQSLFVRPSGTPRRRFDAGAKANALPRNRLDLVLAIGRVVPFAKLRGYRWRMAMRQAQRVVTESKHTPTVAPNGCGSLRIGKVTVICAKYRGC